MPDPTVPWQQPTAPLHTQTSPLQADHPTDENLGKIIAGRYTLIKVLGQGGMGTVYLAEQTQPVRRQVALKLIKSGIDSRSYVTRFEAERQALAVMDHPNIARVYDGGTTPAHQPFFVMELVQGVPITKYCDEQRLTPKERLELFVLICQAVQHAHQKGIIHRDLKPGNVLVTLVDGKPVPKVIDFGLAKATEQPLTDETIEEHGAVGTPAYMSPEQADPENNDVDTRTDIYAMGVILYELLTGSTPIEMKQFRRGAELEILRMVREVDPPKPSTRLSSAEALPSIAANRNVEPKTLLACVRGDIDWIVMKSLEKDRNHRYETANGFAADVQRYLTGEPVLAHPPGRWYRVKKFVRRNKAQVVAAGLIFAALIAGLATSWWQMNRAIDAEFSAKEESKEKDKQWKRAEDANELTTRRLHQIELINNAVFDIFSEFDLRKIKKNNNDPIEMILAQKLLDTGTKLDASAIHDPQVLAKLQNRLGQTLINLGRARDAIVFLTSSLKIRQTQFADDHEGLLTSLNDLARANSEAGFSDNALKYYTEALELAKQKLKADHPEIYGIMGNIALCHHKAGRVELALQMHEDSYQLQKKRLGENHVDTLTSLNSLAITYQDAGKTKKAVSLFKSALERRKTILGIDHPDTLNSMNSLAVGYQADGNSELSVPILEELLELTRKKLGAEHPDTLNCMNSLASAYQTTGKWALIIPLQLETLRLKKIKLGENHPETLVSMQGLAEAYRVLGKLDLAIPLFEETLKKRKVELGADHPHTINSMNSLGVACQFAGKLDLALPLLDETLKLRKSKQGADHPDTLAAMGNLASCYYAAKKFEQSLPLFEDTLKIMKVKRGETHPDTLITMNNLALVYRDAGKLNQSQSMYEETLKLARAKMGNYHPLTLSVMNNLATVYQKVNDIERAIPLQEEALKLTQAKLGDVHPNTISCIYNLAALYRDTGKLELALPHFLSGAASLEKIKYQHEVARNIVTSLIDCLQRLKRYQEGEVWRRKWMKVIKEKSGEDSAAYAFELSMLGVNLNLQKKWNDAETSMRQCLSILTQKEPDNWVTYDACSSLGESLLGQLKYAEAEKQLLKGYNGMNQRKNKIPKQGLYRVVATLDRLIQLYTETKQPEEVKKWQAEKARFLESQPQKR